MGNGAVGSRECSGAGVFQKGRSAEVTAEEHPVLSGPYQEARRRGRPKRGPADVGKVEEGDLVQKGGEEAAPRAGGEDGGG